MSSNDRLENQKVSERARYNNKATRTFLYERRSIIPTN